MSVSNMPGYARIRRGPMAADAFTQIRNAVFRDSRLSAKAMGIFGNISTHRDGWGITAETMSTQMRDGVNSIKSGLRELEEYGYLQRIRERRKDGTLGGTVYFITDQPEAFADEPQPQKPRSAPTNDLPTLAEPTVVDRLHKKTIPLQEDQLEEDHLSLPPVPAQRSESGPVDEREKPSPFNKPQQPPDADAVTRVTTSWTEAYKRSSSGSAPSTKAVARVQASAASRLRAGKTADELASIAADMAETNLAWTDLAEHEAHWLHKQQTLVGAGADGGMWDRALARAQARGGPSTTDARVQAALDLGRQMQAEHDAATRGHQPHRDVYRDHLDQLGRQAANGARPYGWQDVPHCGHLDCDSVTRYREVEDADGLRSLSACPDCHPSLKF